jgi:hypothetical protein
MAQRRAICYKKSAMHAPEQEIYEFDEFRLDIGRGFLLRGGKPVCLQWKTFETLCFLVKSNDRGLRDKISISYFLDGFAALTLRREELKIAAQFAGAAEQMRESINYEIDFADGRFRDIYLAELRAALSEAGFNEFYEQGRKLKLDEAVKLALEE